MILPLDQRPVIVALASSNGAGKTTFYHAHLQQSGLRLINADILARELGLDAYGAAKMAGVLRQRLLEQRESFVFETVFSDPSGDKLEFLKDAKKAGYAVVVIFIGIDDAEISGDRVAMRVSQGGHDVPTEKLRQRYPRIMGNLKRALAELANVFVYDHSDLEAGYLLVATREGGQQVELHGPTPDWLSRLLT